MPQPLRPSSAPVHVALSVELPPEIVAQAREVSTRVKVWDQRELARDPSGYREAEVALVSAGLDLQPLKEATGLRWVQSVGAGVDRLLASELAARPEIVITNASGIHAQPIAEHVFGLLLMFTRNLHLAAREQELGRWDSTPYRETLNTLRGKTLAVLGFGAIGRRIAQIAAAFELRVIGLKRRPERVPGEVELFGPDQLFPFLAQADLLVNILPLTADTRGLLGQREFAALPPGALFINVGRGATVGTEALLAALRSGQLAGAGLDVTEPEPLPADHALWSLPNVIITPHYAGAQPGYFRHAGELFVANLRRYLQREPLLNVVDKRAGY